MLKGPVTVFLSKHFDSVQNLDMLMVDSSNLLKRDEYKLEKLV